MVRLPDDVQLSLATISTVRSGIAPMHVRPSTATVASEAQVVMVGNNLRRDIAGAKALGLTTVWIDWAPRRRKVPRTPDEHPDHTIAEPLELLAVLERLEAPEA